MSHKSRSSGESKKSKTHARQLSAPSGKGPHVPDVHEQTEFMRAIGVDVDSDSSEDAVHPPSMLGSPPPPTITPPPQEEAKDAAASSSPPPPQQQQQEAGTQQPVLSPRRSDAVLGTPPPPVGTLSRFSTTDAVSPPKNQLSPRSLLSQRFHSKETLIRLSGSPPPKGGGDNDDGPLFDELFPQARLLSASPPPPAMVVTADGSEPQRRRPSVVPTGRSPRASLTDSAFLAQTELFGPSARGASVSEAHQSLVAHQDEGTHDDDDDDDDDEDDDDASYDIIAESGTEHDWRGSFEFGRRGGGAAAVALAAAAGGGRRASGEAAPVVASAGRGDGLVRASDASHDFAVRYTDEHRPMGLLDLMTSNELMHAPAGSKSPAAAAGAATGSSSSNNSTAATSPDTPEPEGKARGPVRMSIRDFLFVGRKGGADEEGHGHHQHQPSKSPRNNSTSALAFARRPVAAAAAAEDGGANAAVGDGPKSPRSPVVAPASKEGGSRIGKLFAKKTAPSDAPSSSSPPDAASATSPSAAGGGGGGGAGAAGSGAAAADGPRSAHRRVKSPRSAHRSDASSETGHVRRPSGRRSKSISSPKDLLPSADDDFGSEPGLFGADLGALMALNGPDSRLAVPRVMQALCDAIVRCGGLHAEGIFRLSVGTTVKRAAMALLHRFDYHEVEQDVGNDPHMHCVLLKEWVKRLPQPLIRDYDACLALGQRTTSAADQTRPLVEALWHGLGVHERAVLKHLLLFVKELAAHSDETRMTAHNLCIVFAPGVIRPLVEQSAADMLRDQPLTQAALELVYEFVCSEEAAAATAAAAAAPKVE